MIADENDHRAPFARDVLKRVGPSVGAAKAKRGAGAQDNWVGRCRHLEILLHGDLRAASPRCARGDTAIKRSEGEGRVQCARSEAFLSLRGALHDATWAERPLRAGKRPVDARADPWGSER